MAGTELKNPADRASRGELFAQVRGVCSFGESDGLPGDDAYAHVGEPPEGRQQLVVALSHGPRADIVGELGTDDRGAAHLHQGQQQQALQGPQCAAHYHRPGHILFQEVTHLVVLARRNLPPDHGIAHHELQEIDGARLTCGESLAT